LIKVRRVEIRRNEREDKTNNEFLWIEGTGEGDPDGEKDEETKKKATESRRGCHFSGLRFA
jgi:hypothetical protein